MPRSEETIGSILCWQFIVAKKVMLKVGDGDGGGNRERNCAENYAKYYSKFVFLSVIKISILLISRQNSFRVCCLIKLLRYILFEKYINISALEMASRGNRHCVICIGAFSLPVGTKKSIRCLSSVVARHAARNYHRSRRTVAVASSAGSPPHQPHQLQQLQQQGSALNGQYPSSASA